MSKFNILQQDHDRIIALKYIKTSENTSLGNYIYLWEENMLYKYKLETIHDCNR